eukprot:TRINITY_DN8082_c0_g1_i2.p1 TRINITY_DN8082_c0_g1~~TRINITY_DN8082_c0_g1_i2.p1  ORF type:complete len:138 (-),score=45.25 TRINITY_DN8082_c0_g1_i2:61-474(-)
MEDAHVVVDHFHDGAGIYMGVYDGHGGSDVAVLAAERLHEIVECHLAAGGIDSCIERAFTSSFQVFQEEVVKGNLEGGCTAAVGLIMECPELGGRACYSANVGDALSLIHISEPTRLLSISYAVFCLKKKKTHKNRS